MRMLNPDNLERWIACWKSALKEVENLQLGRGLFTNVVEAAIGELEYAYNVRETKSIKRNSPSWGRRVLSLLEAHFEQSNPIIDLLRLEHGEEVIETLELSLRKEGPYDLRQIYPILVQLQGSPSTHVIQEALLEELLGQGERRRLSALAWLLAQRALEELPAKDLPDLPTKALAEAHVALQLGSRVGNSFDEFIRNDTAGEFSGVDAQ